MNTPKTVLLVLLVLAGVSYAQAPGEKAEPARAGTDQPTAQDLRHASATAAMKLRLAEAEVEKLRKQVESLRADLSSAKTTASNLDSELKAVQAERTEIMEILDKTVNDQNEKNTTTILYEKWKSHLKKSSDMRKQNADLTTKLAARDKLLTTAQKSLQEAKKESALKDGEIRSLRQKLAIQMGKQIAPVTDPGATVAPGPEPTSQPEKTPAGQVDKTPSQIAGNDTKPATTTTTTPTPPADPYPPKVPSNIDGKISEIEDNIAVVKTDRARQITNGMRLIVSRAGAFVAHIDVMYVQDKEVAGTVSAKRRSDPRPGDDVSIPPKNAKP